MDAMMLTSKCALAVAIALFAFLWINNGRLSSRSTVVASWLFVAAVLVSAISYFSVLVCAVMG